MKELELSKRGWKNKGKYKAFVDNDLFEEVNKYNWHYQKPGYGYNSKIKILLHIYIWNLKFGDIPEGLEIEHIDGNGLNCQISNLRLANHSENACNTKKHKDNKSGFKGVYKRVRRKKRKNGSIYIKTYWEAKIMKDGKRHTKRFPFTDAGLKLAKEWYKEKSLELHKEFSIFARKKDHI